MTQIAIIVAADLNNAIGKDNQMLTHLPNDLRYFKQRTGSSPILMGRKTFESLPKGALPNRRNIVISRTPNLQLEGCETTSSIEKAIEMCENESVIYIIGGGDIYKQTLKRADTVYLTRIHHQFDVVDVYFPALDPKIWKEVEREAHLADEKHKYNYTFLRFDKIND